MPEKQTGVFISYSRTDSEFVDRLEADLVARNFHVWVDRSKLEGGHNWLNELEKAIEQCDILLVILSPQAVVSEYVRMEYRFAHTLGKRVIPLEYQSCRVPMDLNGIQWVSFTSTYEQGLKELLIVLSPLELPKTASKKQSPIPTNKNLRSWFHRKSKKRETDLVEPQPAPPPPDPNLDDLYKAGEAAKAEGDLERTVTLWQQILDRDPLFANGTLTTQVKRVIQELRPLRIQRLYERAKQAARSGEWSLSSTALEVLAELEPYDDSVKKALPLLEHIQKYAGVYENALQFAKKGNLTSAIPQLEMLLLNTSPSTDPIESGKNREIADTSVSADVVPLERHENVCPFCGYECQPENKFCTNCGKRLLLSES